MQTSTDEREPMNPEAFFFKYAGWGYHPGKETKTQGRRRSAKLLARAEAKAQARGYSYHWAIDPSTNSSDWITAEDNYKNGYADPWQVWQCVMRNAASGIVNSLHSIDFGRNKEPWGDPYRRVVEAELSIDGLTNPPQ